MPLDQRGFEIETKPDLSTPSLEALSYLLRQQMPPGFHWDFGDIEEKHPCGTAGCAIGLAFQVWPDFKTSIASRRLGEIVSIAAIGEILGMSEGAVCNIFFSAAALYHKTMALVTPADVAAAIDAYLRDRAQP